jgi:hypothetical protein
MTTRPSLVDDLRDSDYDVVAEWIRDTESRHFRTPFDTGANLNALMIWNLLRGSMGMSPLTRVDLLRNMVTTYAQDFARYVSEGNADLAHEALKSYEAMAEILHADDPEQALDEYDKKLKALQGRS